MGQEDEAMSHPHFPHSKVAAQSMAPFPLAARQGHSLCWQNSERQHRMSWSGMGAQRLLYTLCSLFLSACMCTHTHTQPWQQYLSYLPLFQITSAPRR